MAVKLWKRKRRNSKIVKTSKSQYKVSKIFDLSDEKFKFSEMLKMNDLWKSYMSSLIGPQKADKVTLLNKVLKADFHGAIIQVYKAKNTSLEGLEGIVLKETQQAFQILTEQDQLKKILKKGIVFLTWVPSGELVKIFGDAVTFRAFDRSKIKFKEKYVLDFFKI